MISTVERLAFTESAVLELSMFFIRHSLPGWPAKLSPTIEALRAQDPAKALQNWNILALMGEYGLMQTQVNYEDGYRAQDFVREQQHFERLLQQALEAMNHLRLYMRTGVNYPLPELYLDSPI